jgi:hypothetical protein
MVCIRCSLALAVGLGAQCAELSIASATAQPGSTVSVVVSFASEGARVAGFQFDLVADSTLSFGAAAGPAATNAGKDVYRVNIASGRTRLLVAGLNQSTLGDGVAVTLTAFVSGSVPAGTYVLHLANLVASDPEGVAVPLTGADGSITVGGSATSSPSGMFAQVASGDGWTTSLTLLNVSSSAANTSLTFWNDDGTPLVLPLAFSPELGLPSANAAFASFVIPANGVAIVKTVQTEVSGALKGWAQLSAPAGVAGSATFLYQSTGGLNLEAVVPLETRTPSSFVLPFDNSDGISTGVALANGSDTLLANIDVTVRDAAGNPLLVARADLPVRGHRSFMLTDRYPALAGLSGSLEFRNASGGSIAVLGLRMNQSGSLTSIPAEIK